MIGCHRSISDLLQSDEKFMTKMWGNRLRLQKMTGVEFAENLGINRLCIVTKRVVADSADQECTIVPAMPVPGKLVVALS